MFFINKIYAHPIFFIPFLFPLAILMPGWEQMKKVKKVANLEGTSFLVNAKSYVPTLL